MAGRGLVSLDDSVIEAQYARLQAQHATVEAQLDGVHTAIDGHVPEYRDLLRIIDDQPARRGAVATLFFLEELDYDEIAVILGISASTARTQVQRVRERLLPYACKLRDALRGGEM